MEDAVLLGVGVLEFVDHGDSVARPDALAQPLTQAGAKRPVEILEQIVERQLMGLALARLHPLAHHPRGPLQHQIPDAGTAGQQRIYLAEQLQGRQRLPLAQLGFQHFLAEALQLLGNGVAAGGIPGPVAYLGEPTFVVLAGVELDLALGLAADLVGLRQPLRFYLFDANHGFPVTLDKRLLPQGGTDRQLAVVEPAVHLPQQGGGARPELAHRPGQRLVHRIELGAPVVAHRLQPELAVVGQKFGFKQGARFEGVLFQHPLAEAVDGEHRRLVHLPLGGQQPARRLLVILHFQQQLGQQRIRTLAAQEGEACLVDAGADPPPQLGGGGLGEGHHQDLGHRQRPLVGAGLTRLLPFLDERAVAQQQPQVEAGDGVGLAGPGGGLDQPLAMEGEAQGVQCLGHYFSSSRQLSSGVRCSRASACNWFSTSSSRAGKQRAT
ncbi:hypothetical protein D3C79_556200 [compost metagenome]